MYSQKAIEEDGPGLELMLIGVATLFSLVFQALGLLLSWILRQSGNALFRAIICAITAWVSSNTLAIAFNESGERRQGAIVSAYSTYAMSSMYVLFGMNEIALSVLLAGIVGGVFGLIDYVPRDSYAKNVTRAGLEFFSAPLRYCASLSRSIAGLMYKCAREETRRVKPTHNSET